MFDVEQLKGKTIAITGASRGIGRATAGILADLGANLVLGARDEQELKRLASGFNTKTLAVAADVTSEQSIGEFANQAMTYFGKIDALINCAGTGVFGSMLELSTEQFDRMIAVNLRGTFLTSRLFARHMVANRAGQIINVASIAGTVALSGCAGYAASKFGVIGLTRVMQAELRDKGVRVTAVVPGAVATSFWDDMPHKPDLSQMMPVEALAKHIVYILCQPGGAVIDEIMIMPPLGIL